MRFESIVQKAIESEASDILLTSGSPPVYRISGSIRRSKVPALDSEETKNLLYEMLNKSQIEHFEKEKELDFLITHRGQRLRGNAYWHGGSAAVALRMIPTQIPKPSELGLPPVLTDLIEQPHGLILITGATGQGKSTTMASLIDSLNHSHRRHIVTIEDPVEFIHFNDKSIVDQREVGIDTHDFASALKHVLRQDPDIIQVGEMRDAESIQTVISAAETGHLVISALHSNDACQAVERIIDVFPDGSQQMQIRSRLSLSLLAVVAQRLVKSVSGESVLVCEVLRNIPAIGHLIREGKTQMLYSALEINQRDGMITVNKALEKLVKKGIVHQKEADRFFSTHQSRNEP